MKKLLSLTIALAATAGLAPHAQAQQAQNGKKMVDMCIGCHGIPGYQASFPQVYKVPMIAGQNAKYIVSALTAYKKGDRKHPTMRAIADSLTDADMADVAAFYEQQGKDVASPAVPESVAAAPAAVAELLTKGNCVSCHGANFNKPIDASYPKISGQKSDYLFAALKAYQTQNNPLVGRNNAIMAGMVKPFSHAELKRIADYIGSLPSDLKTVEQAHFRP